MVAAEAYFVFNPSLQLLIQRAGYSIRKYVVTIRKALPGNHTTVDDRLLEALKARCSYKLGNSYTENAVSEPRYVDLLRKLLKRLLLT